MKRLTLSLLIVPLCAMAVGCPQLLTGADTAGNVSESALNYGGTLSGFVADSSSTAASVDSQAAQNVTYRLHPATTGYLHSARFPGQVVCLEIRRDQLADPFTPFAAMRISHAKAVRMAAPLAAALRIELQGRH